MARAKKSESVATIVSIKASSRTSIPVEVNNGQWSYYTMEYGEERSIPADLTPEQIAKERQLLWDVVNNEVDRQVEDVLKMYEK